MTLLKKGRNAKTDREFTPKTSGKPVYFKGNIPWRYGIRRFYPTELNFQPLFSAESTNQQINVFTSSGPTQAAWKRTVSPFTTRRKSPLPSSFSAPLPEMPVA